MAGVTATVTFLFVDLVGSTDLLHRIGDDANDELTRRYQALMRETVERHGGEVLRTMGDGLTVIFPSSVAGGVAAAIDMQRAIHRMGKADPLLQLQIRVGLSVGEASLMEGDWSGTPIFEAARLESKARPGTILVNDVIRVLLGNRGGFEFAPVGALELKGFPEPLPAAEVTWEPDPGLPEVPLPSALEVGQDWKLVGRDAELAQLVAAWDEATTSERGSIVTITGPAGVGKTRLLAELAARVQTGAGVPTGTVLYGRTGDETEVPLAPLAEGLRWWAASVAPEVLRRVVAAGAPTLAAIVPSLAARLPELVDSTEVTDSAALADVVVDVISDAAEAGPHLVIVDAAHSASDGTLEATGRVGRLDRPVLVVIASQDPARLDLLGPVVSSIELSGLDATAVADLMDGVAGRAGLSDLPADVTDRAATETHGNPRLVIEAGERLVRSGALGLADGTARDAALTRALSGASPYKGLLAYQADDADGFFGRDDDVAGLLGRLASTRFLAVVGASGSGKSSLVRAGLIPALERGALAHSRDWPVVLFTPGARPLLELAAGIARAVDRPVGEVMAALEDAPDGLDTFLRSSLEGDGAARVVLVVDQFEEVFTSCQDEAERERFAELLLHAATVPEGRVLVALVLRADFYGHCAGLPGLASALESTTALLGPMDEVGLRSVIEGPAQRAELSIEPGLVDLMIREVVGEPGGLPLLSHALYETWERRERRTLTTAGYRAAGGARGAIARTAELVYTDGLDSEQQQVARGLFLALTELGEGTEDTRRRAPRSELIERAGSETALDDVVEVLVAARLITVGDETVELAHEALIREWPRLRDWLDEDRETLRAVRHLAVAAEEWDRGGREASDLYRGPRLAAAVDAAVGAPMTVREREFLEASQVVEEQDALRQARQNRRLRRLLAGVGILLVCALMAGLVAFQQRAKANERTEDADLSRLVSQSGDLLESNRSLGFLLALEANRERNDPATRSALFSTIQRNRDFLGYTPTGGIATGSALLGDRGLATVTADARMAFVDLDSGEALADPIDLGDRPEGDAHTFMASDPTRAVGDVVVAARADTGQIFRLAAGSFELVGEPIEAGQPVFGLASNARTGLAAVALADGTVALYDLHSGEKIGELPTPRAPLELPFVADEGVDNGYGAGGATIDDGDAIALAFSPSGSDLAVARADGSVEVWDPAQESLVWETPAAEAPIHAPGFGMVAYRPDGEQFVAWAPSSPDDEALVAFAAATGAVDWRQQAHTAHVEAVYAPDGDVLYVAGGDEVVLARSPATGESEGAVLSTGFGRPVSVVVDGPRLALVSAVEAVAGEWTTDGTSRVVRRFGSADMYPDEFAPDDSSILVNAGPPPFGNIHTVWDPSTGREIVDSLPGIGAYLGDRRLGIFTSDLTAREYDVDTQRPVGGVLHEVEVAGITNGVTKPSAGVFALGYEDGRVIIFRRPDSPTRGQFDTAVQLDLGAHVVVVAFSPDGRRLLVTTADGNAAQYDTTSGNEVGRPIDEVTTGEYAADGESLFVSAADGSLRQVDADTGEVIGDVFPPLPSAGRLITVSDDGRSLAVADRSGRMRIYDIASRTPIGNDFPPPGDSLQVTLGGRLSHSGDLLAVISPAGGVETWDLQPDHWRDISCRSAGRNLTQDEWNTYLPNAGTYRKTCPEWPAGE